MPSRGQPIELAVFPTSCHIADRFVADLARLVPRATFRGRSVNVNVGEENNNQVAIEAMKTAIDDATKRIKSSLLHNCGDALSELEAV